MNKLTEVHDLYYTVCKEIKTSKQTGRHVYGLEVLILLQSHTLKID